MSGKYWDRAWSLVEECAPVSEGCRNCWARAMDARFGRPWTGAVRFREDRLNLPARTGKQTLWAVWNDLFHASVSDQQVWWALGRMTLAPQHVFLVLTKRPERVAELLGGIQLSDNVWIGVSVEDQGRLGRVRTLAAIGAAHRFVSVEPMLGMVEFDDDWWESANRVGWVICGGETG
ncbi:MAG: DUF5131 family protein, partial [Actinobacteria bacterium]|nr:DUF5131 family protein [Actinomycetota bacterium]